MCYVQYAPQKLCRICLLFLCDYIPLCLLVFVDALLLGSRVRIPLRAWVFVSCVYVLLPCVSRGLCEGADHSSRGVLPYVPNCV
jgi:hypothetical protein